MSLPDHKILSWLMKGPVEYNKVNREIDPKILREALGYDYKKLHSIVDRYFSRYKTPPSFKILNEHLAEDIDTAQLISIIEATDCEETEILFYVDQIRDRFNAELATKLANSVPDMATDIDIEEFNANMISIVSKIERLRRASVFAEGHFTKSVTSRFDDYIFTEKNPDAAAGVLSGFRELDDYTFGIKKSEMMVISGASSSGKSLLMMNYAINAWLGANKPWDPTQHGHTNGKNVLYFTLEMSKKQLEQRMDANAADIRQKALMRGFLSDEEKMRWKNSLEFQRKYDKHFYVVDMPRGSRTLDIEARFDSLTSEFEPDLVVVDYLGIMKPNRDFGQDWLEVGHTAADLHEFCRSKNIAVLTAAQRKARNKSSKTQYNDLEELGRSKMIGDNANIVLLIEQREDELLRDDMVLHVVKNRDGAKGEAKLMKEFEKSKVASIPDNWAQDPGGENSLG
jgi:replicative DNA helicase